MSTAAVRESDGRFAMPAADADLLDRVATAWVPGNRTLREEFLAACKADAQAHAGIVSVNRVREMCKPLNIPPRSWSSWWSHYTGPGQPMRKLRRLDEFRGSTSRNDGKPYLLRRWQG